jgi:uncharacterized integral membrane protein (TIGR00698 family)
VRSSARTALPGLGLVAAIVAVSFAATGRGGPLSPIVTSLLLGLVLGLAGRTPARAARGIGLASRQGLRVAIVLLGFRLSFSELRAVGFATFVVVVAICALTFGGTVLLARRLGLSPALGLLIATGFSICGASAIAAMKETAAADDAEAAYAVGLVTLCGTLAVFLLPPVGYVLGMAPRPYGVWVGASVHDVAQVLAAAAPRGDTAVAAAIIVKLVRVAMLAPLVIVVSLARTGGAGGARGARVPWFVVGFLLTAAIASTGLIPHGAIVGLRHLDEVLLAAALAGFGLATSLDRLRRVGGRPLVVGLVSWGLIAIFSYLGLVVVGVV